jgi:hypothetical protein
MSEHTRPFSRRAFVGGAAAFGISLCLPTLTPTPAHAVTAAEKQAEANAALEKLNAMQEKLDRASDAHFEAVEERKAAEARMDEAQGRIDDASSRISELQGQLGDRARSMFERDKNHTAILFWSCGNESYAGENILAMAEFFRSQDPSSAPPRSRPSPRTGIC